MIKNSDLSSRDPPPMAASAWKKKCRTKHLLSSVKVPIHILDKCFCFLGIFELELASLVPWHKQSNQGNHFPHLRWIKVFFLYIWKIFYGTFCAIEVHKSGNLTWNLSTPTKEQFHKNCNGATKRGRRIWMKWKQTVTNFKKKNHKMSTTAHTCLTKIRWRQSSKKSRFFRRTIVPNEKMKTNLPKK